jgi:hypothetical protein
MDWNDVRVFLAVAREGSMRALQREPMPARDALGRGSRGDAVCAAFSNVTPPTIRTALTISRPQNCERNAPESVGTLFLSVGTLEPTVVRQAIDAAWISASVRRIFIELLVITKQNLFVI